jgi:hypothetical protein
VASPILSNILLDTLDTFVTTVLIPQYTRREKRKLNHEYDRLAGRVYRLRKQGQKEAAEKIKAQMQRLPSRDTRDPDYRRLRYIRYADDVRHLTRCLIPLGERRSSEEMTSGSLGLPGGESQRGNEHAEKAEKDAKTLKPCSARPA